MDDCLPLRAAGSVLHTRPRLRLRTNCSELPFNGEGTEIFLVETVPVNRLGTPPARGSVYHPLSGGPPPPQGSTDAEPAPPGGALAQHALAAHPLVIRPWSSPRNFLGTSPPLDVRAMYERQVLRVGSSRGASLTLTDVAIAIHDVELFAVTSTFTGPVDTSCERRKHCLSTARLLCSQSLCASSKAHESRSRVH